MPKYDFRCTSCETVFEAFRSFSQGTDGVLCPEDGAPAERLFSPPMDMIVFGSKNSSPTTQIRPPGPTAGSVGHGHTHGPGGHTHGPGGHTH
ncbi:MAG: FmdB family zinc ribbon protein [Chloroflexota bacterium]